MQPKYKVTIRETGIGEAIAYNLASEEACVGDINYCYAVPANLNLLDIAGEGFALINNTQ